MLVALGVFLRSMGHQMTNFTFEDTLSQIGFGYPILFLLGFRSPRWQWSALGVILTGYWLAWALYPAPGPGFDWQAVGVPADWPHHLSGFAAHWDKNSNLGQAFDLWFLNLFPRPKHFDFNSGGYLTLSFIPTLGTMILGLIAGRWLRATAPKIPMKQFALAGVIGVAAGLVIHFPGNLPDREAHLDAVLGFIQRRHLLPVPGRLLLGDRDEGLEEVGVPAGGDRHELDRRLLHRAPVRALLHRLLPHQPRSARLRDFRHGRPAVRARLGRAGLLLGHPLLDVPEKDVFAHMKALNTAVILALSLAAPAICDTFSLDSVSGLKMHSGQGRGGNVQRPQSSADHR